MSLGLEKAVEVVCIVWHDTESQTLLDKFIHESSHEKVSDLRGISKINRDKRIHGDMFIDLEKELKPQYMRQ